MQENIAREMQFVITHTICQTEIPAITRQLGYKHTFCQNFAATKKKKKWFVLIFS
jgi:hypothetical protein